MWAAQQRLHFGGRNAVLDYVLGTVPERVVAVDYADRMGRN
jgi:hypothetical protein